jgi:hypothetical protein
MVLARTVSAAENDTLTWLAIHHDKYTIYYTRSDKDKVQELENNLASGYKQVIDFFQQPFIKKFDVYIFPDRSGLNKQWQKEWNDPAFQSQCWMIASGVAHRLDILSPNAWTHDACDHNGNDSMEIRQVIWHELVHVYHGQYNPDHSFSYIENLDWLVEGIATYISGQLDQKRLQRIKHAIQENKTPSSLNDFWKGQDKYGLSGSMVAYLDKLLGRNKFFALLTLTKKQEVLKGLNMSEEELISNWKKSF